MKDVDPPAQQPVTQQEILLDVHPDFRRERTAAVTLLQGAEMIVLAGRKHEIRDQADTRDAMVRCEIRHPHL
jgi:hypothetical protein